MFRKMRRFVQELNAEECEELLKKGTSGVLSLLGDGGYTYGVPLTFAHEGKTIYFHSAKSGHKIDAINKHSKVSFTIISEDTVLPDQSSTCYKSLIAFGKVHFAESDDEKRKALVTLGKKFSPQRTEALRSIIEKKLSNTQVIIFEIEYMTGKEAIEYVRERKKESR